MKRPVHFEILADDVEKVADFYREVLDWEISLWEGPKPYWLVNTGPDETSGINGGLMHRHFSQPVINTIEVESLEEMLRKVEEAGGQKVEGPGADLMGKGEVHLNSGTQGILGIQCGVVVIDEA